MTIRKAERRDAAAILQLYHRVAAVQGGLARTAEEITIEYVDHFVTKSTGGGLELLAENEQGGLVGEIHCYGNGLRTFAHVLGDLTIVVDPEVQGRGIGKLLFTSLLVEVRDHRPDILRVELLARESNERALAFYASIGFRREGRLRKRIRSVGGGYEDDIFMAWMRDEHRPDTPGMDDNIPRR